MNSATKILIFDPSAKVSSDLEKGLSELGFHATADCEPDGPVDDLAELRPDVALLGPTLDWWDHQKCFQKLKIVDPAMPILVFMKADSTLEEISASIENALRLRKEFQIPPDFPIIIGQSRSVREVKRKIQSVADKDVTVLITGETGTGKELIARSIHWHSSRSKRPLVKISCGALPDDLLESEIFGFQRGAFTGAHRDKPGRLEMAHEGTLFIDEIGDLSLSLQVKFLQILEDNLFARLGGTEDTVVEARVVAATNKDLWQKVRLGEFRKDLFYRLNVFHIRASKLKDRPEDIPLLMHYFLTKNCYTLKRDFLDIPSEVTEHFQAYHWPGNIRELENVVRRAVALKDWGFAFEELRADRTQEEDAAAGEDQFEWGDGKIKEHMTQKGLSLRKITKDYVSEAEKQAILEVLEQTQWNRKKAAQMLGVSYKTLLSRIDEFNLKP
ncbi:MAG: sigma-54 dependent transcriptional regulator [Deltaproteobacteria bacterium]